MNKLDQAISEATRAEATLVADTNNLATLQAAVAQAEAPVPAAQAQVSADTSSFNDAMDALSAAALAAKIPSPITGVTI